MGTVLLYRAATNVTGRALARELGLPRNNYGRGNGRPTLPALREADILIRWGNGLQSSTFARARIINAASALAVSGNKMRALAALGNAGLPTPEWTTDEEVARGWLREGVTVFGRDSRGQGGRDILICDSQGGLVEGCDFYSKLVPDITREYRIHVVSGDVIRTQGRYLDHPGLAGDGLIRSHANGWRFRAPRQHLHGSRHLLAIEAVAACGLDFGAVDLAVTGEGDAVIFEVNAAPGCSPLTLSAYASAFRSKGWVT